MKPHGSDLGWEVMHLSERWFNDHRVLIVGGTSGIGAGIGAAFLAHGAHVTVTGATAADIEAAGADTMLAKAMVTEPDYVTPRTLRH